MQEMEEEAEDLNTTIEQLQRKCAEYETQTNTLAERVRLLEKQIRDNNDLHKNPLLFADNENVKILTEKNTEQIETAMNTREVINAINTILSGEWYFIFLPVPI